MKKGLLIPSLALSASLILFFAVFAVNPTALLHSRSGAVLIADGVPLPPPGRGRPPVTSSTAFRYRLPGHAQPLAP